MQRFRVSDRFGGASHLGLGDDFQQRRTGAIQVDAGHALEVLVQALARVFLQMCAREPYMLFLFAHHDRDHAADHDRNFVL